jgi:NitT/TauT family transport system substrate-binding protein
VPYDRWREYDAEDTVGFCPLRLRETCRINSSPQKIIADGTDWRLLNELKGELKASISGGTLASGDGRANP